MTLTPPRVASAKALQSAVQRHFRAPIRHAFTYGSGVFAQKGYGKHEQPLIDLIFAVDDATAWHKVNLKQHRHHYSFLGSLGSGTVGRVQRGFGPAGVYFNPYVVLGDHRVKYGVVEINTLLDDLDHWTSLYLAGRMHKPTLHLIEDPLVLQANARNQRSALQYALLLQGTESFTLRETFRSIVEMSYLGDFRMVLGENPKKIDNIVEAQYDILKDMYLPFLQESPDIQAMTSHVDGPWSMNHNDPRTQAHRLSSLPPHFLSLLGLPMHDSSFSSDPKAVEQAALRSITHPHLPQRLRSAVARTVMWPAIGQSLKGILTAGVGKSMGYALAKLRKQFASS
ncbi:MAG: mitochondrial matrix Mmp37 [Piptocephalis tieghemiana]|nr:MAG: mitochondrial matrix Mmp37 [Piptocephalis tieghemiana]